MPKIKGGLIMHLAMYTLLIILLTVNTITDYKRIKSNKKVIEADNKICMAQKELKVQLEERNKTLKESQEEIIKVKEHFKELKENLSINYDHLAEEVKKRINENSKKEEIIVNIDSKEVGRVSKNRLNSVKLNKVLGN